ncbi:MAG: hypothetical protein JXK04_05825 [Campylobacterales bacterium]|nr:hypothetical protein [Campylobacterales bacterium]
MIRWLFQKIFIAVVPSGDRHDVTVTGYKRKKRLFKESKHFEGEFAVDEMVRFVKKFTEETPYCYIAILNPNPHQGALEGCSIHDIYEGEEMSGVKTLCRKQQWMLYASEKELNALQRKYAKVGLDFVFSPFSLLEYFYGDKIGGTAAVYVLAQKDSISIAFFEEGILEYGHHYTMHREEREITAEEGVGIGFSVGVEEERGRGINLDDIETLDDLEIIDDLDDLGNIEDLDTLEEIVEFSEDEPVMEEKRPLLSGKETKEDMERFNDDFYRFELIEKTLARFYSGEHCRNRFVETVYIADGYGSSTELKRYLEDELFVNVVIRKIDLGEAVIALSRSEEGVQ